MYAVGATLRIEDDFPGVDAALAELPGTEREELVNLEWHADGSYTMLYRLSTDDPAAVEVALEDHPDVLDYELVETEDTWYCFVNVAKRDLLSELFAIVDKHALVIDRPMQFVEDGVQLTVAGRSESLQAAFEEAADAIDVDVEWSGGYDPADSDVLSRLTSRQREAIQTAYELGFYEKPRRTNYEEIAEALECAPSTANELLRRAETAIVSSVLED